MLSLPIIWKRTRSRFAGALCRCTYASLQRLTVVVFVAGSSFGVRLYMSDGTSVGAETLHRLSQAHDGVEQAIVEELSATTGAFPDNP